MAQYTLNVDSLAIQQTMTTLGDLLADLGPSWGKVRDEVAGNGFVGIAVRNPAAREEHLKVLDTFLKQLAQECTGMLNNRATPPALREQAAQALKWIQEAYVDISAAVTRVLA